MASFLFLLWLAWLVFVPESAMSLCGWYKWFREGFGVMNLYRTPVPISHCKDLNLSLMLPCFYFHFLWIQLHAEAGPCGAPQNLLTLCWGKWRCDFTQFFLYYTSKAYHHASGYKTHLLHSVFLSSQRQELWPTFTCYLISCILNTTIKKEFTLVEKQRRVEHLDPGWIQEFLCLLCVMLTTEDPLGTFLASSRGISVHQTCIIACLDSIASSHQSLLSEAWLSLLCPSVYLQPSF